MHKNKLKILSGLVLLISVFLLPSKNILANSLVAPSQNQPDQLLVSVGISQEQNDLTKNDLTETSTSSDIVVATTSLDYITLIAGAIGVAIPWDSIGILGIILFAIMLGLWWHYRQDNVRDWHH